MTTTPHPEPAPISRRAAHLAMILVVLLLTPALLVACGGSAMGDATTVNPAPALATVGMSDDMTSAMSTADRASWSARPDFVRSASRNTQAAYAFAITNGDVLQWMPCYCGCTAMGHGSNVDCFLQRHDANGVAFEEHASVCDVCVKTALIAKAMYRNGSSLLQIRDAIDRSMGGGGAPGTRTALPPA